jgi:hypothetical protein
MNPNNIRRAHSRRKNKLNGLCQCGRKRKPGKKTCEKCYNNSVKYRKNRFDHGICGCGKKKEKNRMELSYCKACAQKVKDDRKRMLKNGFCSCGRIITTGKTCEYCRKRLRDRYKKFSDDNRCGCGNPVKQEKLCDACRTKRNIKRKKNRANGLCRCGNKPTHWTMKMCKACLDINARSYKKRAAIHKKLFRPATKEEKKKYGGISGEKIIKMYTDIFY